MRQKQLADLREVANDIRNFDRRCRSNRMQQAAKALIEHQDTINRRIDVGLCLHITAGGSFSSSAMANVLSSTWNPSVRKRNAETPAILIHGFEF
jgi:hypothetical protein